MLTIKHTEPNYQESLYTAREARFMPKNAMTPVVDGTSDECVLLYGGDVGMKELYGGTVYVMNDHGATVAHYNLDPSARLGIAKAA